MNSNPKQIDLGMTYWKHLTIPVVIILNKHKMIQHMKAQQKKIEPTTKAKKWSAEVTENSDALDLKENVFESKSAKKIAESLKESAEKSHKRKSEPYRSAMSMLTFYINRAGKNLHKDQKEVLENAKDELRKLFGRKTTEK